MAARQNADLDCDRCSHRAVYVDQPDIQDLPGIVLLVSLIFSPAAQVPGRVGALLDRVSSDLAEHIAQLTGDLFGR